MVVAGNEPKVVQMEQRVILVHDDAKVLAEMAAALNSNGYEVSAFASTLQALDAIEPADRVDVLVTSVLFPLGTPHGISLAQMAKSKRPEMRVLFTAAPEFADHTAGIGDFLPLPVDPADLVKAVARLIELGPRKPADTGFPHMMI